MAPSQPPKKQAKSRERTEGAVGGPGQQSTAARLTQWVHVAIWYITGPESSYVLTVGPMCVAYLYLDALGNSKAFTPGGPSAPGSPTRPIDLGPSRAYPGSINLYFGFL